MLAPPSKLYRFFTQLVTAALLAVLCNQLDAQIFAERKVHWSDVDTSVSQPSYLTRSLFALSVDRAISAVTPPHGEDEEEELADYPNRDAAWNISFAELIDIYRWSRRSALSFHFSQELLASARNDIGFNPRSAIWQEEIVMSSLVQFWRSSTSLSVFHRCKHDIDNSDQEEDDEILPGHVQKRTIILGGLAVRQSLDDDCIFPSSSRWSAQGEGRIEAYFYKLDYRYPLITFGRAWEHLRGSAMLQLNLGYKLSHSIGTNLRVHLSELYFENGVNRPAAFGNNTRIELQCAIHGAGSDLVVSLINERLFDNVVRISADPTNTWSLGLMIRPLGCW